MGTWDAASISPVVSTATTSYEWNGDSVAVVVDPFDPSTVWLGTGEMGLYKSTDCGGSWTHVNNGTNGDAIDQSVLWSLIIDPFNRGTIYVVGAYGAEGLWKSINGGNDWVQLFPDDSAWAQLVPYNFVNNVSMDPNDPQHLVVASHGVCNAPYTNGCFAESFDSGNTWPNIVGMPAPWGEKGGVQVINHTTWIWGTGGGIDGLWVTTTNGQSWTQALAGDVGDALGEFSLEPLAPASNGNYYVTSYEGVLRAAPDGGDWALAWPQQNFVTPEVMGIVLSPTTIYAADNNSFYSAPLSSDSNWSSFPGPMGNTGQAEFLAYDPVHNLLYASTWTAGLFRMTLPP